MDELFTPVSTTYTKVQEEPQLRQVKKTTTPSRVPPPVTTLSSIDETLEILKSQPNYDDLIACLKFLTTSSVIHQPTPRNAAVIQVLVSEIVPNYWSLLSEGSEIDDVDAVADLNLLVASLQTITGLNAVLAHAQSLIRQIKQDKRPDLLLNLKIYVDLLAALLDGDDTLRQVWLHSIGHISDKPSKKIQAQSLIALVAGGRVLSAVSEANSCLEKESISPKATWLSNGAEYTRWIGRNLTSWVRTAINDTEMQLCFDLTQRTMSLGYSDTLIKQLVNTLLLHESADPNCFITCCFLQPQRTKKIMDILFEYLAQLFLNNTNPNTQETEAISAVAGVIKSVVASDESRRAYLVSWCTSSSGAGLGDSIGIRRAVLAVLSQDKDTIVDVVEKSLSQFGDVLYMGHAAILQQEVHTQLLLLAAGYLVRLSPIKFTMILRSSIYLNTISNRIASSQPRVRYLGMIVGETLSSLKDGTDMKLDFHIEEMNTDDTAWLKSLVGVSDSVGTKKPILRNSTATNQTQQGRTTQMINRSGHPIRKATKPAKAKTLTLPKAVIEEINSSESGDDDDDLVPYAKGSDPEDSDEDATLVQRNKIKAPVYIRDLILYLRDSESYDKQKLALSTAPVLIRRKANYGTEVSSHADELAGLLVGLQDKFELSDFDTQKSQCIISLIIAQPKTMAPWFARTFFEGDYSLSQRTAVLISIGLAARELAGHDVSVHQSQTKFPSKQLPSKIEGLYLTDSPRSNETASGSPQLKSLPHNAIESIAQSLTSEFLAPVAAEAADANTGPDVLKLQTFTARYKNKSMSKPRLRAIPNTTASLVASYFFSPLTAHFQLALRSTRPVILNPALLGLYLQTLGVIVNAAGPSTLSLPQLTSELWSLLLGIRVHMSNDLGALKGWLVAMAVLLEVNGNDMRRLCETQGREIVETREWVSRVFERIRGGDAGEENDVKMLSAGILIKLGEIIEQYQALLMGDMVGFT